MGGEFTYPKNGIPLVFTHSQMGVKRFRPPKWVGSLWFPSLKKPTQTGTLHSKNHPTGRREPSFQVRGTEIKLGRSLGLALGLKWFSSIDLPKTDRPENLLGEEAAGAELAYF